MIEHIQEPENSDDALERHELREMINNDPHFKRATMLLETAELRDKFAMAALSLYAHDGSYEPDLMARSAYKIADAMLIARAKQ